MTFRASRITHVLFCLSIVSLGVVISFGVVIYDRAHRKCTNICKDGEIPKDNDCCYTQPSTAIFCPDQCFCGLEYTEFGDPVCHDKKKVVDEKFIKSDALSYNLLIISCILSLLTLLMLIVVCCMCCAGYN